MIDLWHTIDQRLDTSVKRMDLLRMITEWEAQQEASAAYIPPVLISTNFSSAATPSPVPPSDSSHGSSELPRSSVQSAVRGSILDRLT